MDRQFVFAIIAAVIGWLITVSSLVWWFGGLENRVIALESDSAYRLEIAVDSVKHIARADETLRILERDIEELRASCKE